MVIHPLTIFAVGTALFMLGLVLMMLVAFPINKKEPTVYRLSFSCPGEYEFKVWQDGTTGIYRVR